MWRVWFADVDLAICPGESVLDWLSHAKETMTLIVDSDGESIGYIRYLKHNAAQVRMFLAKDGASTSLLLGHLGSKLKGRETDRVLLPLHPDSRAV
jgi:hypothetical protein